MPVPHQWKRLFSGSAPEFLSPDVARDLVNTEKAVVLDVREEYEFAEGHASVAVNISVTELKDRMHEVVKLVAGKTRRAHCRVLQVLSRVAHVLSLSQLHSHAHYPF